MTEDQRGDIIGGLMFFVAFLVMAAICAEALINP